MANARLPRLSTVRSYTSLRLFFSSRASIHSTSMLSCPSVSVQVVYVTGEMPRYAALWMSFGERGERARMKVTQRRVRGNATSAYGTASSRARLRDR